eukprot:gene4964-6050_t
MPPEPGGDGSTPQASGGGARELSLRQRGNMAPAEWKWKDTSGPYHNLDDNEDARCQVCQKANRPASILLCDDCNQGYHLSCLQPKLTRVPKEEFWYCPKCLGQLPDTDLTPEYLHAYENRGK